MNKKEKIGIVTLGCSKNTVDSERLMGQLKLNDFEISANPEEADSVVINTCGFIEDAKAESIETILNAVELKKAGKIKNVLVAGCLSERYMEDLKKEIPEVDAYFGTEDYAGILKNLNGYLKEELLGERELTTPKHYAYLKISEGCDNPCSFCAIPLMRGGHRSVPIEKLVKETELLAARGVKELIVIGQDTTDYGKDIYGKRNLAELLTKLSEVKGIEWIKLLYAYPSHFPEDLFDVLANNPKVCKYLDIPLQHISGDVLKSMRRGISERRTKELIARLKEKVPGITIRTTFITGYPAETEKDFNILCDFVKEARFGRVGVFTYSVEETTPAYVLNDPFTPAEKEKRRETLMEIQKDISWELNNESIGKTMKVIIDGEEGEFYVARSAEQVPEVDGEVLVKKGNIKMETGEFYNVSIYDCDEYDLFAESVTSGEK